MLYWVSPAVKFYTVSPSDINLCPQSPLALPKLSNSILLTAFSKQFLNRLLAFSDMAPVYPKFVIAYMYLYVGSAIPERIKKTNKSTNVFSFQLLRALGFQNYRFTLKGEMTQADPESRLHLSSGVTVLMCFRAACASPQSTQITPGLP